ncbi:sulfatase family protein [Motilibacter aurantiacus]|uniref:sulfatase family protein n=1 Tax=Motilibacter aurantiacus TaxID=2714955 RepID=UPI00140A913F|nr:sulfatase-like hydrolase/transferase [Motilibacter aurantiacus]NHC46669.1 sulfatase-like hydrolase/transferase [Motilibacter aurantiacus]
MPQHDQSPVGSSDGISRRRFGGIVGGTIAGLAGAAGVSSAAAPAAADIDRNERPFRSKPGAGSGPRPNILFIIADDLGYADLSSYGSPHIETRSLDRLAREGVRFTNGYSGSATCSPTRVSFYTGRHPGRTPAGLAEPIANRTTGLDPAHPTLASLLRSAGYATALIGKWHCGVLPRFGPLKSGWDEFFGNYSAASEYFSKIGFHGDHDLYENEQPYEDPRYYTTVLAERAVQYIRRDHDKPWLLNLNFTTPHWPWLTEDDAEEGARIAAQIRAGGNVSAALNHRDSGSLETYKKMVESLDRAVGDVLDALRRSKQEDNTVVVFVSDNGGERFSNNWPLRGEKFGLYEGGIRVPTILRWPDRVLPRQVSHEPVYSQDWTATLLELGGAAADPAYPLDGKSLAGYLLRGEQAPERDLFWRVRGSRALRRGDWKYYQGSDNVPRLYDLARDVHEQADRAAAEPALLADLRASWERVDATLLPY